jgi:hypothetical protein
MTKLIIIAIFAVTACGSKQKTDTTPANKTGASDPMKGSTGGATYGNGSAAPMKPAAGGGDPCAN